MIKYWRAGCSRATGLFCTCVGPSPVAVDGNFNFLSSKAARRRGSARTRAISSPNILFVLKDTWINGNLLVISLSWPSSFLKAFWQGSTGPHNFPAI